MHVQKTIVASAQMIDLSPACPIDVVGKPPVQETPGGDLQFVVNRQIGDSVLRLELLPQRSTERQRHHVALEPEGFVAQTVAELGSVGICVKPIRRHPHSPKLIALLGVVVALGDAGRNLPLGVLEPAVGVKVPSFKTGIPRSGYSAGLCLGVGSTSTIGRSWEIVSSSVVDAAYFDVVLSPVAGETDLGTLIAEAGEFKIAKRLFRIDDRTGTLHIDRRHQAVDGGFVRCIASAEHRRSQ